MALITVSFAKPFSFVIWSMAVTKSLRTAHLFNNSLYPIHNTRSGRIRPTSPVVAYEPGRFSSAPRGITRMHGLGRCAPAVVEQCRIPSCQDYISHTLQLVASSGIPLD